MADSVPLVVDVLVRLSQNYLIATNRLKRAEKAVSTKAGALLREIDRQQRRRAARPGDKRRPYWERREKNAVAQLNEVSVDGQLKDTLDLHPFPDVVGRIARWTGCKAETIRKATVKEFSGYPKLVTKLRKLDGSPEINRLYHQLIEEHPELAEKVGIKREQLAEGDTAAYRPGQVATPKRPGRKEADYETVQREAQLVADWERARDAGAYKADFANEHGMKLAQLNAILARVRMRNTGAK